MALVVQPTWNVGQEITSAGLNKIPNGITGTYNGRPLLAVHDGGSGTTSIPNQTWTQVALGTVDIDTHSGWSTSNNQYTAAMSGWYMIMGCCVFSAQSIAGVSAAVRIVVNGAPIAGISSHAYPSDGSSVPGVSMSRMVYLAENDLLHLEAFQDTGATQSSNNSGVGAERPYLDVIYWGA